MIFHDISIVFISFLPFSSPHDIFVVAGIFPWRRPLRTLPRPRDEKDGDGDPAQCPWEKDGTSRVNHRKCMLIQKENIDYLGFSLIFNL